MHRKQTEEASPFFLLADNAHLHSLLVIHKKQPAGKEEMWLSEFQPQCHQSGGEKGGFGFEAKGQ